MAIEDKIDNILEMNFGRSDNESPIRKRSQNIDMESGEINTKDDDEEDEMDENMGVGMDSADGGAGAEVPMTKKHKRKKILDEGLIKGPVKLIVRSVMEKALIDNWKELINQIVEGSPASVSVVVEEEILEHMAIWGMDYEKLEDVKPSDYKRAAKVVAKYMINIIEKY